MESFKYEVRAFNTSDTENGCEVEQGANNKLAARAIAGHYLNDGCVVAQIWKGKELLEQYSDSEEANEVNQAAADDRSWNESNMYHAD